MSKNSFQIDVSARIQRLPPYLFGRINKMKYEKRVAGIDIIINRSAIIVLPIAIIIVQP